MSESDLTDGDLLEEMQALGECGAQVRPAAASTDLLHEIAVGTQSFLVQLLRHTPTPISLTSKDDRYLFVNRAWEELFHQSRRQAVGRFVREVVSPETAAQFRQTNQRVLATAAPLTVEEFADTAEGRHYYQTVRFPVRNRAGEVIAVGAISINITERKRAEDPLRDSEARLRRFFEAAFEGLVIVDQGTILDANQAIVDLFGYQIPDVLGRNVLEFIPEGERERVRERIRTGDERVYESVGLRRDGTQFPIEIHGKSLSYHGHTVRVSAVRDITARKKSDALLRDYAQRLDALSHRLLEVQEEERRNLSRELHDEIGQILTGLNFTLEMGARSDSEGLRQAVREARGLVQDLTSRVRDLSLRLRPTMLDDLGLLPALFWHFERYTAQTRVRVHFEHRGLDRRLPPDSETAAYRIIQEALTNVARHAGVTEARVGIWLDGLTLRLEIEDEGAGFDPEAALSSGQCCGLSGLRQRASLLGGQCAVTSAPGAGSRLAAEWPVASAVREVPNDSDFATGG
jgi:PAS domain S-box-containing protein